MTPPLSALANALEDKGSRLLSSFAPPLTTRIPTDETPPSRPEVSIVRVPSPHPSSNQRRAPYPPSPRKTHILPASGNAQKTLQTSFSLHPSFVPFQTAFLFSFADVYTDQEALPGLLRITFSRLGSISGVLPLSLHRISRDLNQEKARKRARVQYLLLLLDLTSFLFYQLGSSSFATSRPTIYSRGAHIRSGEQ